MQKEEIIKRINFVKVFFDHTLEKNKKEYEKEVYIDLKKDLKAIHETIKILKTTIDTPHII